MTKSSGFNPFHQFEIHPIIDLSLAGHDISITNSTMWMFAALMCIPAFIYFATRNASVIPGKLQSAAEIVFQLIDNMVYESNGAKGKKFFPFIFTVFAFILTLNLFGMLPYSFTVTSHIIVTFSLAIIMLMAVILTGLVKHGLSFFSIFLPKDIPIFVAPLLVVIEIFSFLSRPVSLSVRLAGNMIAGHVLLKVLASFVIMMGITGVIPIAFIIVIIGLEIFVAILQAYIFTILTCVYLNDAINLH